MAKRTIEGRYQTHDAALSIRRELLSAEKDAGEVYYRMGEPEEHLESNGITSLPSSQAASLPVDENFSLPTIKIARSSGDNTQGLHPDTHVQVSDIMRAMVGDKLKRSLHDVPLDSTIKRLTGGQLFIQCFDRQKVQKAYSILGRSTLENEIVGDLLVEFESLPERPEDIVLDELCSMLEASFKGFLGKKSSVLVARMISTKMPGGFILETARGYLESRWRFPKGLQDIILLRCLNVQPLSRLSNEEAARSFLDGVSKVYAEQHGLVCDLCPMPVSERPTVDPRVIDGLTMQQSAMSRQKLELYAKDLQIDLQAGDKAHAAIQKELARVQVELDTWATELGEVYGRGIKPIMNPLKARAFDSSWNWALQTLLGLYHGVIDGTLDEADPKLERKFLHIANGASTKLIECMEYLRTHCQGHEGPTYGIADGMLEQLIMICKNNIAAEPVFKSSGRITMPQTIIDGQGRLETVEVPRKAVWEYEKPVEDKYPDLTACRLTRTLNSYGGSMLRMKSRGPFGLEYNKRATATYLCTIEEATRTGISFHGKHVLLTGAGKRSIGSEILQGLLAGGAKVLVTTNSYSPETIQSFRRIYTSCGARGSQLILVPFNQGSQQDVESLITYVYDPKMLGWDLDILLPFAAISESGRDITNIDSKSELAHRAMLTNTIRLVGAVQRAKQVRGYENRPTQVILPLSANHGTMGNDGLYAESKMALESLMNKWASEDMGNQISICGAAIGWTRGTGLMAGNDIIAEGMEKLGVRTFSQEEMALNILALATPVMMDLCQEEPLFADLNGGLESIPNLSHALNRLRQTINERCETRMAIHKDASLEMDIITGAHVDRLVGAMIAPAPIAKIVQARANIRISFPELPDYKSQIEPLAAQLNGMVNLDRIVVIAGFAEIGPYGNSRTRWDMEAHSSLTVESCLELAWMMGLIKQHPQGKIEGHDYSGWVDAKTEKPVHDGDIKTKYEEHIMKNCGIRLVKAEGEERHILQEVVIQQDLQPFNVSKEIAEEYQKVHKQKADIYQSLGSDEWTVRIKAGASIMVPKSTGLGDLVAAKIPSDWNPRVYGVSEDLISQVDPTTLYTLVCTVEALLAAGITDFYEVYQYVHTTEVGNCIGSGMGGMKSSLNLFKDRFIDKPIQNDILQETFVNTIGAWVNMLLLSSNGTIKTPVGACATSIESLDSGCDLIISGKAKICLVGGVDDFTEEVATEFANMKATIDPAEDISHGRVPREMSRPMTSTRNGFVESHGCGIQVVTSARLALDMGLPIHGIVSFTGIASDKIGRSVPAPGKGIVSFATGTTSSHPSPLLSMAYRRQALSRRLDQIEQVQEADLAWLSSESQCLQSQPSSAQFDAPAYISSRASQIALEAQQQRKAALQNYGQGFYTSDTSISPIRGSLAVWGLTPDDIDIASLHGTSTPLGDLNEVQALEQQFTALRRSRGNRVMAVCQKGLLGHGKGAAGAWAINGACQMLATGTVPGIQNADNIDSRMESGEYLIFPEKKVEVGSGLKAVSITSFGFGQKGAQAIVINPKYLFAACDKGTWDGYRMKLGQRKRKADGWFSRAMAESRMFVAKETTPFEGDDGFTDRRMRLKKNFGSA